MAALSDLSISRPAKAKGSNSSDSEPPTPGYARTPSGFEIDESHPVVKRAHIHFNVECHTSVGEQVYVVGNDEWLGNWDPAEALPLMTGQGRYPTWSGIGLVEAHKEIEYKYIVVNESEGTLSWESGPNRRVTANSSHLRIEDGDYGSGQSARHGVDHGWIPAGHFELRVILNNYVDQPSLKLFGAEPENIHFLMEVYPFAQGMPVNLEQNGQRMHVLHLHWTEGMLCEDIEEPLLTTSLKDDGEIMIFHRRVLNRDNLAVAIRVYSGGDCLGLCYLTSNMLYLGDTAVSNVKLPIHDMVTDMLIGELAVQTVIVDGFSHPANNLSGASAVCWNWATTLNVGHRGLGRSHAKDGKVSRTAGIEENTVLSLVTAAKMGADFVEFDVSLTKDNVPIVYHDLDFCVEVQKKGVHTVEPFMVATKDLTLAQVRRLEIQPKTALKKMFKSLVEQHFITKDNASSFLLGVGGIPTLQEVLCNVPESAGFNIEIKYPDHKKGEPVPDYTDRNFYLNTILDTVFSHAGERQIVFSCFDPTVCSMLRLKQARYPVMQLTCGGNRQYGHFADRRADSVESTVAAALAERLLGVVSNSTPLIRQPCLIDSIKGAGIILFTWGDENDIEENVCLQIEHGVDAIICDNVGEAVAKLKKGMCDECE